MCLHVGNIAEEYFSHMDRHKYQEILESIKIPDGVSQEDLLTALRPLNIALLQLIPEHMYKYRNCDKKHVSAFEKDEVWLSTSDLFNDPFDTLIQYDEGQIRSAFDSVMLPSIQEAMLRYFADGGKISESVSNLVSSTEIDNMRVKATEILSQGKVLAPTKEQMISMIIFREGIISMLPKIAQRFSSAVCFSEKIDSILMWSHYSYNHTGFALGYDMRPFLLPNKEELGLYPVIYSEKRYNAEEFLLYLFGSMIQAPVHLTDKMSSIKLLSYKSLDWQYEQEWRLIKSDTSNLFEGHSEPILLKPNSIYYGCRIAQDDYKKLHEIALRKGIEEHFMTLDNASDEYKMRVE